MKTLNETILSFDNWENPGSFCDFIYGDKSLCEKDQTLFKEIWDKANDSEFWRDADLILCCKGTQVFIRENYTLSETAISNIVRAISYQWR